MKAFGSKLFAKGGKRPTSGSGSPAAAREAEQSEGSGSTLSTMQDEPSTETAADSPPPPMWSNQKPSGGGSGGGSGPSTETAADSPPPPMWSNQKPPGGGSGGGSGPPPPMWGNKKPADSGGGGGPPPPMWGNKKPVDGGGGGGGGPPPPMWGNKKPAESPSGSGAVGSSSVGADLTPVGRQISEPLARKVAPSPGEEKPKKYIKQYEIGVKLGAGAYAKVKMCVDMDTGTSFAIKIFKKSLLKRRQSRFQGTAFDDVLREIAIMRKLDHVNVVNMHDVIDDVFANKLYMVIDFCKHGAIMDSNEMPCSPLELSKSRKWFADAVVGLDYLHFQGVAHFDLKPDNILIGPEDTAVIADFGVSRIMKEDAHSVSGSPGTPTYTAPEAYGDVKYDPFLADVWSFGVTLHAMAFGALPYMSHSQLELIELITAPSEWACAHTHADDEMMDLMRGMLCKDLARRLTLAQVKEHPWVAGELATRSGANHARDEWAKIEIDEEELRKAVIAGHVANFRKTPHGTLLKTTAAAEARTYKAFEAAKSPVARFLPELRHVMDSTRKRVIIEMADLTHGVEQPCLMDIKMATRTFTEEDAASQEQRADLLAKMLKVNPDAATPAEAAAGGITKMRYLRFREGASTSATLGFRVDAVQLAEGLEGAVPDSNELKSIDSVGAVNAAIRQYIQYRQPLAAEFALRLRELREALEGDDVFMSHSFVRTSLLFVYSAVTCRCSVHLIDMSKVQKAARVLAHRGPWQPGNDEDGYLDGLDALIRSFEELSEETHMAPPPSPPEADKGGANVVVSRA